MSGSRFFEIVDEAADVVAIRPVDVEGETAGELLTWPTGRNDACWCGRGRKYERCCGRAEV